MWIFSQHKAIYGSLAWAAMYCTPFGSSRKFWLKISAQDIAFGRYIYAVHELAPARQSVMFFDLVQHELDSAHKITTISWDPCTAQLTCMFENQSNVDRSRPSFLWPKSLAADTHATSRSMSVSMYTWFNSRYWQTSLFAGDFCMQRLLARMHLIAIPLSRSRLLKARVCAKVANTV